MTRARAGTRVAVAQIACHPAIEQPSRSPLEDPLFSMKNERDTLPTPGAVPEVLAERIRHLRERIRTTYCAQLLVKLRAIVTACRAWDVQILLLPEYSAPWQLLDDVAAMAGDMVVIAGTHTVTREARKHGLYQRLGGEPPAIGEAVAPVLHRGKLLGMQAKLSPAKPEAGAMVQGTTWAPINLPPSLPSPLGVLICLDFLTESSADPDANTREKIGLAQLLAVPSWTPTHTMREFEARAWVRTARHRTPVLYANVAGEGGSAIYVDDEYGHEVQHYPERIGRLSRDEEGVIVADIDFRAERRGSLTPYDWRPSMTPVALASLVYRTHPIEDAYARWLEEQSPRLVRDDDTAVDELLAAVAGARTVLQRASQLPGIASRVLRLRRLLGDVERMNHVEDIARLVREIVIPEDTVPFPLVRAAMAHGAALAIDDWMARNEMRPFQARLIALRDKLDEGGRPAASPVRTELTDEGLHVLSTMVAAVRGEVARPVATVPTSPTLPPGVSPPVIEDRETDHAREALARLQQRWLTRAVEAGRIQSALLRGALVGAAEAATDDTNHPMVCIALAGTFEALRIHIQRYYRLARGSDGPRKEAWLPAIKSPAAAFVFPEYPNLSVEPKLKEDKYGEAALASAGFAISDLALFQRLVTLTHFLRTATHSEIPLPSEEELLKAHQRLVERILRLEDSDKEMVQAFDTYDRVERTSEEEKIESERTAPQTADELLVLLAAQGTDDGRGYVRFNRDELANLVPLPTLDVADMLEVLESRSLVQVNRSLGHVLPLTTQLTHTGREAAYRLGAPVSSPKSDAEELRRHMIAAGIVREETSGSALVKIVGWPESRIVDAAHVLHDQGRAEVRRKLGRDGLRIALTAKGRTDT